MLTTRNPTVHLPRLANALPTTLGVAVPAAVAALFLAAKPFTHTDVFWLVRSGQWMLAHHRILTTGHFALAARGVPVHPQEWLWEVIAGAGYTASGFHGLLLLGAAQVASLALIGYLWALRRAGSPALATLASLLCGVWIVAVRGAIEPDVTAVVLFAGIMWLLETSRERPRIAWWIPALTLAWAQVHGTYPIAVAATAWAVACRWRGGTGKGLLPVLGATAFAALFHPGALSTAPWGVSFAFGAGRLAGEWQSPNFGSLFWLLTATLAAVAAWLWLGYGRRDKVDLEHAGWAFGAILATLVSQRLVTFGLAVAPPFLAAIPTPGLADALRRTVRTDLRAVGRIVAVDAVAILLAVGAFGALRTWRTPQPAFASPTDTAIWEAASYLAAVPGVRRFGPSVFGTFALWHGVAPVWDQRMDIYAGAGLLDGFIQAETTGAGLSGIVRRYGVNAIVAIPYHPALALWAQEHGWKALWARGNVQVFAKEDLP